VDLEPARDEVEMLAGHLEQVAEEIGGRVDPAGP
jgi:hypothetical protein